MPIVIYAVKHEKLFILHYLFRIPIIACYRGDLPFNDPFVAVCQLARVSLLGPRLLSFSIYYLEPGWLTGWLAG